MPGWVVPAVAYIFLLGATGVTTRYALRTITWEQMVLWVPVAYLPFAIVLATTRGARFPLGIGGFWAADAGGAAPTLRRARPRAGRSRAGVPARSRP